MLRRLYFKDGKRWAETKQMRIIPILPALAAGALSLAVSQAGVRHLAYARNANGNAAPQCHRENLSVKEGNTDAAMGGVRATDFVFTNKSSSACTLNGYPRFEVLDRRGQVRRRAVDTEQLPGDSEKTPPQLVTLEPGKTAWFRIYYNSGGAGRVGKPCPTYPRLKIVAPGTTRAFVLRSNIQSCRRTEFQVSAVRSGRPPQ